MHFFKQHNFITEHMFFGQWAKKLSLFKRLQFGRRTVANSFYLSKNLSSTILLLIACTLAGCLPLYSHQTGRTLGKGNWSGAGYLDTGELDGEMDIGIESWMGLPVLEMAVMMGVTETIDVGARINTSGNIAATGKLQIAGNKRSLLASSLGMDLGTNLLYPTASTLSYNTSLVSFNSIHFTDKFALTFAPRYSYLHATSFSPEGRSRTDEGYIGYSAGFVVGHKVQFSAEFSQFVLNNSFQFSQIPRLSVGVRVNVYQ